MDAALATAAEGGFVFSKEQYYGYISQALSWTDAAVRAIGIIKEQKSDELCWWTPKNMRLIASTTELNVILTANSIGQN